MLRRAFPCLLAACAMVLTLALGATAGRAGGTSARGGGPPSTVRLFAGNLAKAEGAPTYRAGIEIKLAPGWKTYWRYPGEAGIPPRFDFAESKNVKAVRVLWPAPIRFTEGGTTSIGYKATVVFPLRVEPLDPAAPVILRAKVDYAVCDSLCMPAEAKAEIALGAAPAATTDDEALRAAETRVPQRAALGEGGPLAIMAVRTEAGQPQRVLVDVKGRDPDLFAEGPTDAWSLPLPEKVGGAPGGMQRFAFELDGIPKDAPVAGAALTLTGVSPDGAAEVTIRLD